ncbi:hypothetical protein GUITHDRAFT_136133 [Guillardia theta CCMP2712]|uniref:Uncharacterized protein n=1 Tax=Guillardia theta (strain CCMP2712) TaxID=905079 RepID=L1JN20_GUITC|nr:hypothetical protein GUITHDRAFT_136133 [Guillardia theta CCMP2712]EKX49473.1 hypothetical protein GUITHDRAFT_136133 [Guillardia theta CCMP2712]|eukprot:XP_005836453.1 hypothetical protein GUITHDRAFT_136133 [Guillardia theta CCMP2712]
MVAAFHPPPCLLSSSNIAFPAARYHPTAPSALCLKMKGSAEEEATRMGGRKGFYVRPSKALEKGGGFYVPGLEGYKLKLAVSVLAFSLLAINRVLLPGYQPTINQQTSEAVVVFTALFILIQSLLDKLSDPVKLSHPSNSKTKNAVSFASHVVVWSEQGYETLCCYNSQSIIEFL